MKEKGPGPSGKKKSLPRRILKCVLAVLLVIVLAACCFIGFLTVTEYNPKSEETLVISNEASKTLTAGSALTVMTWNIGYGALGDNADFFMDGGSSVVTATEDRVNENMRAVIAEVEAIAPDVMFFQETDISSDRSHKIDEKELLTKTFSDYETSFATNFKVSFVPYPIPPIGKVYSGILTQSAYAITSSTRLSLPVPFSWPVRIANLKRCLNVSRVPVEGTDQELVLINLHLEAYDSGEGKAQQTQQLAELIQTEIDQGNYVIAGGDFNQVFSSVDDSMYPTLPDKWEAGEIDVNAFDSSLQFLMDTSAPTCRSLDQSLTEADSTDPEDFQYYMIDGFIVSSNIEVQSVETQDLEFVNSDHNPVVLKAVLQ